MFFINSWLFSASDPTLHSSFIRLLFLQVGINYFVRVLQQGAWPLSQNGLSPLAVPVELEKTIQMVKFREHQLKGRLRTVDFLIKIDCFVKK
jgi:hypothetical protein